MEIASLFDWQTIISGTLVAIIGCLVRYYSKKIEKYKREAEAKEAERRESENRRRKQIDNIIEHYGEILEWQKKMDEKFEKIKTDMEKSTSRINKVIDGGLALLRDRILQSCRNFVEQGSTSYVARENITEMYKAYHNYGGNGVVTRYYEEYMKLPVLDGVSGSVNTDITSSCIHDRFNLCHDEGDNEHEASNP